MLKHTGCVNGFYYENAPVIRRIGITGDNKETPKTQIRLPRYDTSMPAAIFGNPQFVNYAKICAMETVNVCRVGTRCVGILIKYSDPKVPPAILGQWYGSKESDHRCIYDYNKTTSTVIAFKLSESERAVRDVLICNHDAPELEELSSDIKVQVYKIGTRLVWWFNTRNDSISLWEDGNSSPSSIPIELALVQNFD
ncbi:d7664fa2-f657-49d3-b1b0-66d51fc430cc [Sclerotinia trifoliorum]|uniref:D7664fa2-f657-49d3-b1b0-66d51fc430cc n=1 Tax=Sclerotinia trifoliorum TaxID=28548 RepID=A0A8H2VT88_9HELO|nr:d7664fa2-f657-49d3-b1b0-66d51fc430cc [Sclerotinia trifoliorum]